MIFQNDVAGTRVAVARLADRTDVDHEFLFGGREDVFGLVGGDEFEAFQKDARHMRVPLEAAFGDQSKKLFHLLLVVNVFWEDVLVDRVTRRTVDEQPGVVAVDAWQGSQKVPTEIDLVARAVGAFELVTGPENGTFGSAVKTFGVEHRPLVMVAEQAGLGLFDHQVKTFARVGAVADDVAETENFVDLLVRNVRKHRLKCFEIAVDVADDCAFHLEFDLSLAEQ